MCPSENNNVFGRILLNVLHATSNRSNVAQRAASSPLDARKLSTQTLSLSQYCVENKAKVARPRTRQGLWVNTGT